MQPTHLHVRSVTALRDLDVDLSTVPPGLCAVVGDNGAGKTTLLECMLPAPAWLTMPTRPGSLSDCVTGRDGLIDLSHTHLGTSYRHVVTVDTGASDKSRPSTEAFLYVDGQPVNDGKIGTYAEAVAARLPSQHLVLASAFAAQDGSGSFAQLDTKGRRALFRAMLGLDGLQALADRATLHRKPLDAMAADLDRVGQRLDLDTATAADLDTRIAQADAQVQPQRDAVATARQAHVQAQATHATQAAILAQLDKARGDALRRQRQLQLDRSEAVARMTAAQLALDDALALVAQADAIAADLARRDALRTDKDRHAAAYREARADLGRMDAAAADRQASRDRAQRDLARTVQLLAQADQADAGLADLQDRAQQLADAQARRPQAAADADAAGKAHRQADDAATARQRTAVLALDRARGALDRATTAAAQLDAVPCGGRVLEVSDPATGYTGDSTTLDCSACSFLTSGTQARDQLPDLRTAVDAAEAEAAAARGDVSGVADLRAAADAARQALRDLDALIAQLSGADHRLQAALDVLARRDQLAADRVDLQATLDRLAAEDQAVGDQRAQLQQALQAAETAGREAAAQLAGLGDVDARQAALQRASGQVPVLQQAVADHAAARDRADTQLAEVEVPADPQQQRDQVAQLAAAVTVAARAAEDAQDRLEQQLAALGRLRGQRQALGDLDARRAALAADRDRVARRRAGWVLLERAFGEQGIQALEIDAAGPGVSDLCNDLLQTVGAAYTVQLRTVREASGNRVQREVFDVLVHDGRTGTSRELSRMSGGEQVLVEEAIKLAIAVHVSQRTGQGLATLWRDECDGALSDSRARAYPAMLRLAAQRGGYGWCYFITHRPDVAAQADSVLLIADGRATVLDPGTYAQLSRKGRAV